MRGDCAKNQLELAFPVRHGGVRPRAGRKRLPGHLRHTEHRVRLAHSRAHPVHVTLRARLRCLRKQVVIRTVLGALGASNRRTFRITQYSVQENHIHLIVEADDSATLSAGMHGLMVRLARRVNRRLSRRGAFWADRWHDAPLIRPLHVRNVLVYVLQNHRKHGASSPKQLDPFSSAQWFDGFAQRPPHGFESIGPPCVLPSETWLGSIGWRRHGLIRVNESPKRIE